MEVGIWGEMLKKFFFSSYWKKLCGQLKLPSHLFIAVSFLS